MGINYYIFLSGMVGSLASIIFDLNRGTYNRNCYNLFKKFNLSNNTSWIAEIVVKILYVGIGGFLATILTQNLGAAFLMGLGIESIIDKYTKGKIPREKNE